MPALKGAFINLGAGLLGALPNVVVFQFNPETVSRSIQPAQPPPPVTGSGTNNAYDQPGPASESMTFSLRIDATDQLASVNPIAIANGILPALSALELLMVPQSALEIDLFHNSGQPKPYQLAPARLPTVLFFWGRFRLLPVTIVSLAINETEYDQLLNPIRAEATVSVQVLTPSQAGRSGKIAKGAYEYSQGVKEVMAALNLANTAALGIGNTLSVVL